MPLEVIGAGCGRTGTKSLKDALEILGFPCYHMFECGRLGHETKWNAALTGEQCWDAIFDGFRATVDFPAAVAYKELMQHYPDAKVILSVRDPSKWAASVMETIWSREAKERSLVAAPWFHSFQRMATLFRKRFFRDDDGGLSSGAIDDPQRLAALFEQWVAEVKASVPPERLLVFQASDGWKPLCAFLGVPEPAVPFPRVNDSAVMKQRITKRWRLCAAADAAVLVGALMVGVVALRKLVRVR